LPAEIPAFLETRKLLARKWEALHTEGGAAAGVIGDCWASLGKLSERMKQEFPLDDAGSAALRRELKRRVTALYEEEVAALEALGAWS
ncbi:MAG TPA: hypothetical protein VF187_08470, partial [Gemmatimonadales bacterium]